MSGHPGAPAGGPAAGADPDRQLCVLLVMGTSAGGVGRYVGALSAGLVDAGHQVVIAAPAAADRLFGLGATGARVVPIPLGESPHPARDARVVRMLRRLGGDVDVVHAQGMRAGAVAGLAGGPAALVVTLHNAAPAGFAGRAVFGGLERLVACRATTVLCVSPDLGGPLGRRGVPHIGPAVVPSDDPQPAARSRAQVRAELGIAPKAVLAVSVGRLAAQKRPDVLIEALATLRERPALCTAVESAESVESVAAAEVVAIVAGDGPLEGSLARLIHTRGAPVRLLGRRDDVPDLLGAADLAVSAAAWEGQPLWLQEALVAGLPVVATDVGGTRAIVQDAGEYVPAGDSAALARAIGSVVTDDALAQRLRAAARRRAAELPTAADAVTAAVRAYRQAIGEPRTAPRRRH